MDLLLESEVAALLRRSRRYVRQLRQAGQLHWLPGAGRAPILISKQSVQAYLERTMTWQEKLSLQDSSNPAAFGTSSTRTQAAHKEQVFGQKIYKSRKSGFRVG